jgi:hypothetical protein
MGLHTNKLSGIEQRLGVDRSGDLFRPGAVGVDHRNQRHPRQRREDPGVVAPEVTDTDDCEAKAHTRPTIAMPA